MRPHYFASVLDACVIAPMPVADTLLRLAEHDPPFYGPLWSHHILAEVKGTLLKFGCTEEQASRRIKSMEDAFPEALIIGYETLIQAMQNDPKDRHVLAAAVRAGADCIVSDNLRHFTPEILNRLGLNVSAQNSSYFVSTILIQTPLLRSSEIKPSIRTARSPS